MPYEFTEFEYEPEAQASSPYDGVPPTKWTAASVLDPSMPPKKLRAPVPALSISLLVRIVAAVLLAGIGALTLLALFHGR